MLFWKKNSAMNFMSVGFKQAQYAAGEYIHDALFPENRSSQSTKNSPISYKLGRLKNLTVLEPVLIVYLAQALIWVKRHLGILLPEFSLKTSIFIFIG